MSRLIRALFKLSPSQDLLCTLKKIAAKSQKDSFRTSIADDHTYVFLVRRPPLRGNEVLGPERTEAKPRSKKMAGH